jgi:riboflavin kinase / FMN adenylyltransferase
MEILEGLDGLRNLEAGTTLSVGNFDGIHLGHQRILRMAAGFHRPVALVTFEPHPLTVLRPGHAPPRLTPPALKQSLLEEAGVDYLVLLPPTAEVLNLSAEEFWRILRDEVQPAHMIEGESFNFGKGRGGTIEKLKQWTAQSDVELHIVPPVTVPLLDLRIVPVSSSLIRWLLGNGRVRDAAICLGHSYVLEGTIVRGHERGRSLNMPTANLHCGDQQIPLDGVYAGRCEVEGTIYPAAVSIGTMPTFGTNARQVEAHLIGFSGDLYGQNLRVEMLDWLREQRKYKDINLLITQMRKDLDVVKQRAELKPEHPIVAEKV